MSNTFIAISIAVMALVTLLLRAFPFLVLGNKTTPGFIVYLSKYLPYSIMGMLVIYCVKNVSLIVSPHGLPELIAIVITGTLQAFKRNTLLSIIVGTIAYMLLIQLCF
ncbi:MAG: AzlD domain-containing protein [Saccharofermentans sp.]|nr:AzlD domain-containing protein [Saccharofermentans sp.]